MSLLQTPSKESPLSDPLLITLIMTTSSCSHKASLSFVSFLCRNYTLHRPGAPLPFPSLPIHPCPPPSASETVSDTISHGKSCLCPKEVVRAFHRCLVPTPVLTIPSKTFFSCFFLCSGKSKSPPYCDNDHSVHTAPFWNSFFIFEHF